MDLLGRAAFVWKDEIRYFGCEDVKSEITIIIEPTSAETQRDDQIYSTTIERNQNTRPRTFSFPAVSYLIV